MFKLPQISEGRTLLCIALYRKVNSLEKERLSFITSLRDFMKKYHIDRAFEVKLLILDFPLAYFQLLGKLDKEQRCPCECMKVTGQKKRSSAFPHAWKPLNLTGNSLSWNPAHSRDLSTLYPMGTEPGLGQSPQKSRSL